MNLKKDIDEFENLSGIKGLNEEELFEILDQINYDQEKKELNEMDKIEDNKNIEKNIICNCKSGSIGQILEDRERGFVVCTGCGSVLCSILDRNPEWKQYIGDNDRSEPVRCSFPTNYFLPQSSLGTSIGYAGKSKLKTLHGWGAMPYKERSLYGVLKEIQSRCRSVGILKCAEDDAKIFYKNISECTHTSGKNRGKNIIIRGTNRDGLKAACVYFACKKEGQIRSPKEIAKIFDLNYTDVTKGIKTFEKLMKIREMSYYFTSSTPEQFVPRFCRMLHIKNDYLEKTLQIAKNIQKLNIASVHTPLSVATGSILLMSDINGLPITRKTISTRFRVSEVTISKAYKKIEPYKNILVNNELTEKLYKIKEEEEKRQVLPNNLKDKYQKILKLEKEYQKPKLSIDHIIRINEDFKKRQDEITEKYQSLFV